MSESVVVAMSGGVDSSVAAALLCEQGFEVIGVTLRMIDCGNPNPNASCCGLGGVSSAEDVAACLSIPYHVLDAGAVFEERVLRGAWQQYAQGRTPSPCLICNESVKLGLLCEYAARIGARWVATGHHARIGPEASSESGVADAPVPPVQLLRGRDRHKDQSYFLARIRSEQLAMARFPVGVMTKAEVRRAARERGLPSADRPESQDACLVAEEGGFAEALRQLYAAPALAGSIVDPAGAVLGTHAGIHRYTIGQRRGLGVSLGHRAYVSAIRPSSGEVVLTDREEDLLASGFTARSVRWMPGVAPEAITDCLVQIRYRSKEVPAHLSELIQDAVTVRFDTPQRAVTPGQAAVFYQGERVLGSGWIE